MCNNYRAPKGIDLERGGHVQIQGDRSWKSDVYPSYPAPVIRRADRGGREWPVCTSPAVCTCPACLAGFRLQCAGAGVAHTGAEAPCPTREDALAAVPALRAAAGQASFCLRTLLPDHPDAKMTVGMLCRALAVKPEPLGATVR